MESLVNRLQQRYFLVHIANFYLRTYIWIYIELISEILKSANGRFWLFFYFTNVFVVGCLFTTEEKPLFMLKEMFIEIRLCNLRTYYFKEHVKIVEMYMVKFNVSILNRLRTMVFFVSAKYIHKFNVILNKTVTKLFTILTKCFFSISEPYKLP